MAGNLLALAGGTAAWVVALFQGQSPLSSLGDVNTSLAPLLSPEAAVWLPGTEGYVIATDRWTPRKNPSLDAVIDVATEEDVARTVSRHSCGWFTGVIRYTERRADPIRQRQRAAFRGYLWQTWYQQLRRIGETWRGNQHAEVE
jgi:hypothetical protein